VVTHISSTSARPAGEHGSWAVVARQLLSGFTATADIQGAHIGTNLMSRVDKWFY
jgi:hypothetical protein